MMATAAAKSPYSVDRLSSFAVLPEASFLRTLCLERKRTERSRRRFILMLLESEGLLRPSGGGLAFASVVAALAQSTRETDVTGWYKEASTIGIIFTEIGDGEETDGRRVANALLAKITNALSSVLDVSQINQIRLSIHVFPEDWDSDAPGGPTDQTLYPDQSPKIGPKRAARSVKRMMDIAGSLLALIFLAPLFLIIAVAIKATSSGPVLFRQTRLGRHGRPFAFLKFRSMYNKKADAIHEEYIKTFIAGKAGAGVYKLTADPRVTRVGRFLRKTSLDELPQFLNVLKGEMSLVGPRPPIGYEVARYDIWHKNRLLLATPGITGLWQVEGRSKVSFDEMVRLDLQYARSWSLWLDIRILLQTPRAVVSGTGAY